MEQTNTACKGQVSKCTFESKQGEATLLIFVLVLLFVFVACQTYIFFIRVGFSTWFRIR